MKLLKDWFQKLFLSLLNEGKLSPNISSFTHDCIK